MKRTIIVLSILLLLLAGCIEVNQLDKINSIEEFAQYLENDRVKFCEKDSDCSVIVNNCVRERHCGGQTCDYLTAISKNKQDSLANKREELCSDVWALPTQDDFYDCLYLGIYPKHCYEKLICVNNTCKIIPKIPINQTEREETIRKQLLKEIERIKEMNATN